MRLMLCAFMAALGACGAVSPPPSAPPPDENSEVLASNGNWVLAWVITDPVTGCQYLKGSGRNADLLPRLNADGTQHCVPPEEGGE